MACAPRAASSSAASAARAESAPVFRKIMRTGRSGCCALCSSTAIRTPVKSAWASGAWSPSSGNRTPRFRGNATLRASPSSALSRSWPAASTYRLSGNSAASKRARSAAASKRPLRYRALASMRRAAVVRSWRSYAVRTCSNSRAARAYAPSPNASRASSKVRCASSGTGAASWTCATAGARAAQAHHAAPKSAAQTRLRIANRLVIPIRSWPEVWS